MAVDIDGVIAGEEGGEGGVQAGGEAEEGLKPVQCSVRWPQSDG